jgi:hypothetical protein
MSQQLKQWKIIQVCSDWYSPYIRSSVWLRSLLEDFYVELLCFITVNWKERPTHMQKSTLLRYITSSGSRGVASASNAVECTKTGLESVSNVVDGIIIYLSS